MHKASMCKPEGICMSFCLCNGWNVVRCGEMWWDVVRCGEMWWDVVRCGEMWWDVVRCGEMRWDVDVLESRSFWRNTPRSTLTTSPRFVCQSSWPIRCRLLGRCHTSAAVFCCLMMFNGVNRVLIKFRSSRSSNIAWTTDWFLPNSWCSLSLQWTLQQRNRGFGKQPIPPRKLHQELNSMQEFIHPFRWHRCRPFCRSTPPESSQVKLSSTLSWRTHGKQGFGWVWWVSV